MQLVLSTETTTLSYWLNWRVLMCAIWVFSSIVIAWYLIWMYEVPGHSKANRGEIPHKLARTVFAEEAWRPCMKQIHPIWLLVYRFIAFGFLLTSLVIKTDLSGFRMFYYYTQWTFTLVTIYFAFGSLLSIYGCYQHHKNSTGANTHPVEIDAEQGSYMPLPSNGTTNMKKEIDVLHVAGKLACIFQILYQMSAGAVMLTDSLYWIVIFPFLTIVDYNLNFMTVNMHTLNAILLLGDTMLNSLRFPWFRIAYFFLWTAIFVIFQWIVHMFIEIWWPYPFLDLSSCYAPLWYLSVALMHFPCYAFFSLVVKIKHYTFSRWFPQSYQS